MTDRRSADMDERSNTIPVTEDEVRTHYGRIAEAALLNNGEGLFDAVEAWVQLRQSRFIDPRIARIEALVQGLTRVDVLLMPELRAILGGDV